MTTEEQQRLHQQGDSLYERFGKPLEEAHWGEFIVISPTGQIVLGATLVEAAQAAAATLGHGNFAFKVGERSVATWK
jgi:hypothetical protein